MPSRSVSMETPSHAVSSFDHFVTQWLSTRISSLGRARNESQDQLASGSPASLSIANVHCSRGVYGVGPAESTGKSSERYCPGGSRESSRSFARLPLNPRETYAIGGTSR